MGRIMLNQTKFVAVLLSLLLLIGCGEPSTGTIRVTTWNLQWFPNSSPKERPTSEQELRIKAAADVLRPLDSDILLLQEVKDYDACTRLAEAIKPNTYHVAICSSFDGKQQEAILAKLDAQAGWYEQWKSREGIDPPRGFAFAWYKIKNRDLGVYSVHLKSNLILYGDSQAESARNILKREIAVEQLLDHLRGTIATAIPSIKSVVIGGDFNTNTDQPMFASEKTLQMLVGAGFTSGFESLPLSKRVTHPANNGYPNATFDYLFSQNTKAGIPIITTSSLSDHFPVTRDIMLQ